MEKRIETGVSKTAQWTCMARAMSYDEKNIYLKSNDYMSLVFIPDIEVVKNIFRSLTASNQITKSGYEQVIARTKYIDEIFEDMVPDIEQVVIFGAGFDTRAIRFYDKLKNKIIFEIDSGFTQKAKINRYIEMKIEIPDNLKFIEMDFQKKSIEDIGNYGFQQGKKNIFVLEGLLPYLDNDSADKLFKFIMNNSASGSIAVFDYITKSFIDEKNEMYKSTAGIGEKCNFTIEENALKEFLSLYNFDIIDHSNKENLENRYFTDENGNKKAQISGIHGNLVTALLS